jgi:hypothetical protein
MAKTAILAIRILSDADSKGFDKASTSTSGLERNMGRANKAALGLLAGVGLLAVATQRSASRAQQAAGAVESAFGRQAKAVDKLAAGAATRVGLAASQYGELASVLGSQLRNLGVSEDQLVGTTDDLIQRGADLAATFGGTTAEAVEALSSLMRGERDPIERYGVSIKDADIQAQLAAQGLDGLTGAARKQAETQATLALLTQQTANATGTFAREATSAAGASQIAAAQAENAKAAIGQALLPVVVLASQALGVMAGWMTENAGAAKVLVAVVAGLAAAVVVGNAAIKAYSATHKVLAVVTRVSTGETVRHRISTIASTAASKAATVATTVWTGAQKLLNLALRANPIGIVITAAALLVTGLIALYRNSETFRNAVKKAGDIGKAAFQAVAQKVQPVVKFVQNLVGWIKDAVAWLRKIKFPEPPGWLKSIGGAIGSVFGASEYPGPLEAVTIAGRIPSINPTDRFGFMPHAGGGGELAALAALAGAGGGLTVINVNGALDPDAVARQIERLLERRSTRTGRGIVTRRLVTT